MKALIAEDDTILGFISFGMHAGEVMSVVQLVMLARQPYTTILDAIVAHRGEGLTGVVWLGRLRVSTSLGASIGTTQNEELWHG